MKDQIQFLIAKWEERLAKFREINPEIGSENHGRKTELKQCLSELKAVKEEKWISVNDRLPEITMNTMSDWVITFDKTACRLDKAFYSKVTGWQAEHGEKMNVTHWQELPTPPKN